MSDLKYEELYHPITKNPLPSSRKQPTVTTPPAIAGYPEKPANTQTMKIRGTGAATKGIRCSTKMG